MPAVRFDGPVVVPGIGDVVVLLEGIVENWQRLDLKPFELAAHALIELRDQHGLSQDEIARLTGKPKSEISRFVSLRKIAPDLRQELREDESSTFSRRHLVAVAKLPPEQQRSLTQKIKTEKLTAPETECAAAVHMLERTWNKSPQTRAGTVRRFVIGAATVEVSFGRSGVADPEVPTCRRASKLVEQQLQKTVTRESWFLGLCEPRLCPVARCNR